MIDWVKSEGDYWGAQMRWVYCGKDGWPPRSALGKMIDEGTLGASASRMVQHFPEVLNERALKCNNVIRTLKERARNMFVIHHVVIGKGKVKAARMGITRSAYYDWLDEAHSAYSIACHTANRQDSQICSRHEETQERMIRVA